jgi:hypothetical protein
LPVAGVAGGFTGGAWQAARISAHATATVPRKQRGTSIMGWLVFESLLAGAILVGIVWWTMRPARKRDRESDDDAQ